MGRWKRRRNGNECGHIAPRLIVRCDGGRERGASDRAQRRDLERKQEGDGLGVRILGLDRAFLAGFCLCLALCIDAPTAMAAMVSCKDWNMKVFFERADATDVSRCLKAGADVNAGGRRTPLHRAAKYSKTPAVVKTLLKAGARVNAPDKYDRTPLHVAAEYSKTPAVVEALLKAGADVNAPNFFGWTPVSYARIPAVAEIFLQTGANLEARDELSGRTPLHLVVWRKRTPAVVEALLKAGADMEARDEFGLTPLHFAAHFSKTPAIVETLLQASAAVNARNRDGQTPLHVAAEYSKTPAVAAALLGAGADPAAIDKAGKTPWDYALKNAALRGTDARRRMREERLR